MIETINNFKNIYAVSMINDKNNELNNFTTLEKTNYLKLLLIVINFSMYNYLYKQLFAETNINITFPAYQTIPIPENLFLQDQQPFINIVDKIIEQKANDEDTTDLETQLDIMVYKLYGLCGDEIDIVEGR